MAAKQMRQWGDEADADKREKEGLPPEEYLPEVETIRQLREGFPMLGWYTRQAAPYLHARMTAAEPGSRLDMGRLATNELRTLIALLDKAEGGAIEVSEDDSSEGTGEPGAEQDGGGSTN